MEEMGMEATTQILQLRLMVDKAKMRVVYAECGREMADVFFSFLTTPIGSLVRSTHGESGLGCMDSLYKSVEDMDSILFETPACRDILLRPWSACGFAYERLKISFNDAEQTYGFWCHSENCPTIYSFFRGVKCQCGEEMTPGGKMLYCSPDTGAVFIRLALDSFIVTDDLFIAPSSQVLKSRICTLAGVELHSKGFEEHVVLVDFNKMIELMKVCVFSKTPITDTFLSSNYVTKPINWPQKFLQQNLILPSSNNICHRPMSMGKNLLGSLITRKEMTITLFHNKKTILFAKVEKDFVDLLFSFLTFPSGSVVAAFDGDSGLGCLDNLHKVPGKFVSDGHFHLQTEGKLVNPPIAHHHSCENLMIQIGGKPIHVYQINCETCRKNGVNTRCKKKQHAHSEWKAINPKYERMTTERGGGYTRGHQTFIITNALVVRPFSDPSYQSLCTWDMEEKKMVVGIKEVKRLLKAALVSPNPLTDVFLHDEGL